VTGARRPVNSSDVSSVRTLQPAIEGDECRLQLPVRLLLTPEALLGLRQAHPKALHLPIVVVQLGAEAVDLTPELRARFFDDVVQLAAEPGEGRARSLPVAVGGLDRLLGQVDGLLLPGHPLLLNDEPTHNQVASHGKDSQPLDSLAEEPHLDDERVACRTIAGGGRLGAAAGRCDCQCHHDDQACHLSHETSAAVPCPVPFAGNLDVRGRYRGGWGRIPASVPRAAQGDRGQRRRGLVAPATTRYGPPQTAHVISPVALAILTETDNIYTAPEYSGGGDGKNWLHVLAHLVIAAVILPLVSWGISSLVMLVTKKVAPRTT